MTPNESNEINFPDYVYDLIRKNPDISSDDIAAALPPDVRQEYERYYGRRWVVGTGYVTKPVDWCKVVEQESVYNDLCTWMTVYPWNRTEVTYRKYDPQTDSIEYIKYPMDLDGYSQCQYNLTSVEDRQCFLTTYGYVNLFICTIAGGICCRINLRTSECIYYAIGEDDGSWCLTSYKPIWTDNENYWKNLLMSEISELKINGLNHQAVIAYVWNNPLKPEIILG